MSQFESDIGLDDTYDFILGHFRASGIVISRSENAIRVGPVAASWDKAELIIHAVSPTEVVYSVGHTHIEEASSKPASLDDLLTGFLAWLHAARQGKIVEKIGRKSGNIVRTTIRADIGGRPLFASYSRLHWPSGVRWETIRYRPYAS